MNLVMNLGDPAKAYEPLAHQLFDVSSHGQCKLTGVKWFAGASVALTSPAYGAAMVVDALTELLQLALLRSGDAIVLVGSMGSLSNTITLEDVVLPNPCLCAYYGFQNDLLEQDHDLLYGLECELQGRDIRCRRYLHGSSYAVYDRHLDHETYKSSAYSDAIQGVDCGEVFLALEMSRRHAIAAAAVLFCSDSPSKKITDIGAGEFAERATKMDFTLNSAAVRTLQAWQARK